MFIAAHSLNDQSIRTTETSSTRQRRQALNAIAVAHGRDVWEYREIRCGERKEVIIRF
jgi:hypothetical protein